MPDFAFSHLERSLQKISLSADLENNSWEDTVVYLVPTWHQKGIKLSTLKWPENQLFEGDKIKKVPSWAEKGTNFLHKKVKYLISILSLSAEPISLNEMMSFIGYKNRKAFRENYMQPLEKVGWIARTNPEVPFDPEQKYFLTEAGKAFLGGSKL